MVGYPRAWKDSRVKCSVFSDTDAIMISKPSFGFSAKSAAGGGAVRAVKPAATGGAAAKLTISRAAAAIAEPVALDKPAALDGEAVQSAASKGTAARPAVKSGVRVRVSGVKPAASSETAAKPIKPAASRGAAPKSPSVPKQFSGGALSKPGGALYAASARASAPAPAPAPAPASHPAVPSKPMPLLHVFPFLCRTGHLREATKLVCLSKLFLLEASSEMGTGKDVFTAAQSGDMSKLVPYLNYWRESSELLSSYVLNWRCLGPRMKQGPTPLIAAAQSNAIAAIKLLLAFPGVDLCARGGSASETALEVATKLKHSEAAKLISTAVRAEKDLHDEWDKAGRKLSSVLRIRNSEAQGQALEILSRYRGIPLVLRGGDRSKTPRRMRFYVPIIQALAHGHMEVFKMLVNSPGCDVNQVDEDNMTALMHSCALNGPGSAETVKMLLARPDIDASIRAHVTSTDEYYPYEEADGRTALEMAHEHFEWYAHKGQDSSGSRSYQLMREFEQKQKLAAVVKKKLLVFGTKVVRSTEITSALWEAASDGYEKVVAKVLELGGDLNAAHPATGNTALAFAAAAGHAGVVSQLLSLPNADINRLNAKGHSALMLAACGGHAKVVEVLLTVKGINMSFKTKQGRTAVDLVPRKMTKLRDLLLATGAMVSTKGKADAAIDDGALISAAGRGDRDALAPLLQSWSGNKDVLNSVPWSGYQQTDKNGGGRISRYPGMTALGAACHHCHVEAVQMLLATPGVDVCSRDKHVGSTALIHACSGDGDSGAELEQRRILVVKLLLEHGAGASINATQRTGSEFDKREQLLMYLCETGGYTALMHAAQKNHVEIVKLLIKVPGINIALRIGKDNLGWSETEGLQAINLTRNPDIKALLKVVGRGGGKSKPTRAPALPSTAPPSPHPFTVFDAHAELLCSQLGAAPLPLLALPPPLTIWDNAWGQAAKRQEDDLKNFKCLI